MNWKKSYVQLHFNIQKDNFVDMIREIFYYEIIEKIYPFNWYYHKSIEGGMITLTKYHIDKNGVPAICRATKRPCPLGGPEAHFDSMEEANKYAQDNFANNYGIIAIEDNNTLELTNKLKAQRELVLAGNFNSREEEEAARTELARLSELEKGSSYSVENLKDLLDGIHSPDSGATFSIKDQYTVIVPTTGFCASPYPQYSKVFESSKDVDIGAILDYLAKIDEEDEDIFSDDETYLGLWNDPKTGKVYLDISKRYRTAEEARIACEKNDQIAYFDLQTFQSVDVNRNATSGQKQSV